MERFSKENDEFKDKLISEILEEGSYSIANNDFEDKILHKIYTHVNDEKAIVSKIKLSLKFFYFGMGLVFMCLLGFILRDSLLNQGTNTFVYTLALFFSTILGILLIDNYKRIISRFSLSV